MHSQVLVEMLSSRIPGHLNPRKFCSEQTLIWPARAGGCHGSCSFLLMALEQLLPMKQQWQAKGMECLFLREGTYRKESECQRPYDFSQKYTSFVHEANHCVAIPQSDLLPVFCEVLASFALRGGLPFSFLSFFYSTGSRSWPRTQQWLGSSISMNQTSWIKACDASRSLG